MPPRNAYLDDDEHEGYGYDTVTLSTLTHLSAIARANAHTLRGSWRCWKDRSEQQLEVERLRRLRRKISFVNASKPSAKRPSTVATDKANASFKPQHPLMSSIALSASPFFNVSMTPCPPADVSIINLIARSHTITEPRASALDGSPGLGSSAALPAKFEASIALIFPGGKPLRPSHPSESASTSSSLSSPSFPSTAGFIMDDENVHVNPSLALSFSSYTADSGSHKTENTPWLAYTRKNILLHAYAEQLNQFLISLDTVRGGRRWCGRSRRRRRAWWEKHWQVWKAHARAV
ncbi:hypothetical protein PUNSTDRAFT_146128 [Punctularia strigosozonata HHB-11173 SS5]|uniref:Uncharacterized protein n=1 Tax=Punctularia strigosozonata (strain HHB-11173) TaxID=741275 RepID=R7S4Y4_PUNST|nr:uncharacterized protein PUNSTDRAFT_146128 [Punctularia strigosozonata HHB-11173 SS5]EIN05298.1 hypothetical protein PUNSTDRAFT_146128 [Punctularia strigosozonata HHB-11173 SS5]